MNILVSQINEFVLTAGLGLLVGMFFHLYHVIMKRTGLTRFLLYFFDLFIWLLMVILVFLALLLINHGEMRSHVLVALVLGALFYRMYLWKRTQRFMSAVADRVARVCSRVFRMVFHPWIRACRLTTSWLVAVFPKRKGSGDDEIR